MYVLIVSTIVTYNSLFSSSIAMSEYAVGGLTLEQCKVLGEKVKVKKETNTIFEKALVEKDFKCVNIKEVVKD